ncbi:MAG TPA: exodeoxyribonuclease VII large subunit [Acidobacteriaceae bacterium]|nr:exodeoxyribonuclease VII large subunit [Acidobacteriaceae bacterium]
MSAKSTSPQMGFRFEALDEPRTEKAEEERQPRRRVRRTWQVHELVTEARELIESEFGDIWVEGEISNLRPASSGHLYFTLKDAEAQLPVVLFRRQAMLLRFRPEDGLHVLVRGKATVYEQRGQLQLVGETMEPVGAGSLQLAFEQLRERLRKEGLFDQERKQALPAFPRTVAIVTSPTGAVIRDFLNVTGRRNAGLNVVLIPVAVQGESAAAEIEAAIVLANQQFEIDVQIDVIVLARGGGSLEDMAAFNSERVARAIAASDLPVVSAVGHETDFTIADFVADLRAPTPSAAAELITESQHKVEELVESLEGRLMRVARYRVMQARQQMTRVDVARVQQRLLTAMHRLEQRLDDSSFRLEAALRESLRERSASMQAAAAALLRHDPRRRIGKASEELSGHETRMRHALERRIAASRQESAALQTRLGRAAQVAVANQRGAWRTAERQLRALSPLAVLERGYALVQDSSGTVVRSTAQLSAGQVVQTRMSDGAFTSTIDSVSVGKQKKNKKETRES